ncbi:MAG: YdcF family protein [Desulforudis sp.]|jgi:hypothetical protein|nr:MAG: YdcF family protein [Desulforudis sp.]
MARLFKTLFFIFALLIIIEAACFVLVRPDGTGVSGRADLLVSFKGPGVPTQKVFSLLKDGAAARFAIPGTPQKTIASFTRKYGLPSDVKYIPAGDRTASTFEDALQAGKVIRDGGFRDVLLVAAEYHVARAKLLLWAETLGSGCRITVVGIPGGGSSRQKVAHWYNEAVKLPGSVFELVWYHATGRLLTSYPRLNGALERVKGGVLCD